MSETVPRENAGRARFAPDYKTIFYGALWDGDICRVYTVRPDSPESAPLNLPSATRWRSLRPVNSRWRSARNSGASCPTVRWPESRLRGGAPRELLEDVKYADWSPDGRELAVVRRVKGREQLEFPMGTVIAEPANPGGGFSFPRVDQR